MLKSGQFALVTNDCAVRKGEKVELADKNIVRAFYGHEPTWDCWYNGIKVDVKESNLTPIKAERWKPKEGEEYWYLDSRHCAIMEEFDIYSEHEMRYEAYNCFRTEAEALAEAEATLADRKARLDK
jgi:hypothetical protein